jgi:tRNA threonylcarbamoyladenosine biosynthesis protein TsaB
MLLAIDTATKQIGLALHNGTSMIAEKSWRSNNNHTIQLTPAIQRMMEDCEVDMDALTSIAVSIGPGSYTGLRIGISVAKAIAGARSLPLVGVTTLDTLAAGQPYQTGSGLIAVVEAGRGRIIVKTYRWKKGQWASHVEPRLMTWESLLETVDGPAYVTGEIDAKGMEALESAQQREIPITIAPGAHRLRRAGYLAEIAWTVIRENTETENLDPNRLAPVYISDEKA